MTLRITQMPCQTVLLFTQWIVHRPPPVARREYAQLPPAVRPWSGNEVTLQHGRLNTETFAGTVEQRPDLRTDGGTVGVDLQFRAFVMMPRHMHARDPRHRQPIQKGLGVIAMITGIDLNIVDVQQQVAVGLVEHRPNELQLTHGLIRRCVVADVLDRYATLQRILYLTDARTDMMHGLFGEGMGIRS